LGGKGFPLQSLRGRHRKARAAIELGLLGLEIVAELVLSTWPARKMVPAPAGAFYNNF